MLRAVRSSRHLAAVSTLSAQILNTKKPLSGLKTEERYPASLQASAPCNRVPPIFGAMSVLARVIYCVSERSHRGGAAQFGELRLSGPE
jgi:hypothetical protein